MSGRHGLRELVAAFLCADRPVAGFVRIQRSQGTSLNSHDSSPATKVGRYNETPGPSRGRDDYDSLAM